MHQQIESVRRQIQNRDFSKKFLKGVPILQSFRINSERPEERPTVPH